MKRFYEFITKANQVLLFLALLVLIGFAGFGIFNSYQSSYAGPQVTVAPANAAPATTAVKDVRFLGTSGVLHVFGIVKRTISPGGTGKAANTLELHSGSAARISYGSDGELVNVTFAREKEVVKTLLPQDGLILRHQLSEAHDHPKFSSSLFVCVTEDTNRDAVLDFRDRQDLVIVPPDLQRSDIIIKHYVDFDIVTPSSLVVKTLANDTLRFTRIDVTTGTQTELAWK